MKCGVKGSERVWVHVAVRARKHVNVMFVEVHLLCTTDFARCLGCAALHTQAAKRARTHVLTYRDRKQTRAHDYLSFSVVNRLDCSVICGLAVSGKDSEEARTTRTKHDMRM